MCRARIRVRAAPGKGLRPQGGFVSKPAASKLAEAVAKVAGVNVAECYQCGKCTAGCPMARYMDIVPSQIMRLVQIGDDAAAARLLASGAIWMCAGCLTCTQRCPKKLDPAAVIDALREMAYERGTIPADRKRILAFHKAFLKIVEETGRMSEMPMTGLYKTMTQDFFSDVTMAPLMLLRGKLPLVPKVIRGRKDVKKIFRACRKEGR
jgi:heterodisulfide reductase subunit C2